MDVNDPQIAHLPKKDREIMVYLERQRDYLRMDFRRINPAYNGRFIAVHEQQIIDSDTDEFELAKRMDRRFPGIQTTQTTVLITSLEKITEKDRPVVIEKLASAP